MGHCHMWDTGTKRAIYYCWGITATSNSKVLNITSKSVTKKKKKNHQMTWDLILAIVVKSPPELTFQILYNI